ncbi:hypothetical protein H0H87_007244 [Tephrocybe sp. NHM501043]|nr:hypothetical protein H0H87_007244 [Tephrocybe sp. NHM501043]
MSENCPVDGGPRPVINRSLSYVSQSGFNWHSSADSFSSAASDVISSARVSELRRTPSVSSVSARPIARMPRERSMPHLSQSDLNRGSPAASPAPSSVTATDNEIRRTPSLSSFGGDVNVRPCASIQSERSISQFSQSGPNWHTFSPAMGDAAANTIWRTPSSGSFSSDVGDRTRTSIQSERSMSRLSQSDHNWGSPAPSFSSSDSGRTINGNGIRRTPSTMSYLSQSDFNCGSPASFPPSAIYDFGVNRIRRTSSSISFKDEVNVEPSVSIKSEGYTGFVADWFTTLDWDPRIRAYGSELDNRFTNQPATPSGYLPQQNTSLSRQPSLSAFFNPHEPQFENSAPQQSDLVQGLIGDVDMDYAGVEYDATPAVAYSDNFQDVPRATETSAFGTRQSSYQSVANVHH